MRRGHAEVAAQFDQQRMLAGTVGAARTGFAGAVNRQVGDRFRRFQAQEGPRMDLGGERNALPASPST
jgi:hypothetical protein